MHFTKGLFIISVSFAVFLSVVMSQILRPQTQTVVREEVGPYGRTRQETRVFNDIYGNTRQETVVNNIPNVPYRRPIGPYVNPGSVIVPGSVVQTNYENTGIAYGKKKRSV